MVVPANGITLYAVWQQAFLLTYNVNDNYNTIYTSTIAVEQKPVTVNRIGYILIGWYKDPSFVANSFVTFPLEITENTNLYAKWEAVE